MEELPNSNYYHSEDPTRNALLQALSHMTPEEMNETELEYYAESVLTRKHAEPFKSLLKDIAGTDSDKIKSKGIKDGLPTWLQSYISWMSNNILTSIEALPSLDKVYAWERYIALLIEFAQKVGSAWDETKVEILERMFDIFEHYKKIREPNGNNYNYLSEILDFMCEIGQFNNEPEHKEVIIHMFERR